MSKSNKLALNNSPFHAPALFSATCFLYEIYFQTVIWSLLLCNLFLHTPKTPPTSLGTTKTFYQEINNQALRIFPQIKCIILTNYVVFCLTLLHLTYKGFLLFYLFFMLDYYLNICLIISYPFNLIDLLEQNLFDIVGTTKNFLFNIPLFFFLQYFFIIVLSVWARAAGPRTRVDQIFTFTWKEFFLSLSLLIFFFSIYILISMSVPYLINLFSPSSLFKYKYYPNSFIRLFITRNLNAHIFALLAYHSLTSPVSLSDFHQTDIPPMKKSPPGFNLIYTLFSSKQNLTIHLHSFILTLQMQGSFKNYFSNLAWPEREVREMFGTNFINKDDDRNLLLDFNFMGFPLTKLFNVYGYVQAEINVILRLIEYWKFFNWTNAGA